MWEAFKRVIKPRGAIVLTASQPFTSALVMSNPSAFRYSWVWDKVIGTGFLDANRKPLKRHEDICVFGFEFPVYYPQMDVGTPYKRPQGKTKPEIYRQDINPVSITDNGGWRYPKTIITQSNADKTETVHPTQKPVALFRYLIRTYTQPGELVFDPTCGSGTTGIAARQEARHFIIGDNSADYVDVARKRLSMPFTPDMFAGLAS